MTMRTWFAAFLLAGTMAASGADAPKFVPTSAVEPAVGRYLVTLGELGSAEPIEALSRRIAASYGVRLEPFASEGVRGFMIVATPAKARLVSLDPRVASVAEQSQRGELETPQVPVIPVAPVVAVEPPRPLRMRADAGGTSLTIGSYTYDPTGNIHTITGTAGTESFHYDPHSRLKKGTYGTEAWQEYDYDRYGNITKTRTKSQAERIFGVDAATNQIDLPNDPIQDVNGVYDDKGNLTKLQWGIGGVIANLNYDALNVVTDSTIGNVTRRYLYSATDERIATIDSSGSELWTIRDPGDQVLRRFVSSGNSLVWTEDYVYHGTALLASFGTAPHKTLHYHLDHLGTPRLITGNGGVRVSEHRYLPFGEELTDPGLDAELKKFTGHERDLGNPGSADDLDYMHARYYGTAMGRFSSVDPLLGDPSVPQSWNRYAYAFNNPLNFADPTGMKPCKIKLPDGTEVEGECIEVEAEADDVETVDWEQNAADFFAGFGDSLTFGGTKIIREAISEAIFNTNTTVNPCSTAYAIGEYTEIGLELAATGGAAGLRVAASQASRRAVRSAARKATRGAARQADQVIHHSNPLFGHPGGAPALFPTGGLPAGLHSGSWNLQALTHAQHMAAHRYLRRLENAGRLAVNPGTTAARAGRNLAGQEQCGG
jgi:RHS repeat-associated protein